MPVADVMHRQRVLKALGVTSWQRRAVATGDANTMGEVAGAMSNDAACVVLWPADGATRELDLMARALASCGAVIARAARIGVAADRPLDVPVARAYLACGEAQAHALGRSLPMDVMQQAQIVLADEPAQILRNAAAKRRLWIALRTLRRALSSGS